MLRLSMQLMPRMEPQALLPLVSKLWEMMKMIPEEVEEVAEAEEVVPLVTESQRREAEDKPLEKL